MGGLNLGGLGGVAARQNEPAAPTTGSNILDRFGEGEGGEWKPNATRKVLKEIHPGVWYVVTEKAGENRGSWSFESAEPAQAPRTDPTTGAALPPLIPGGGPAPTARFPGPPDPTTGEPTFITMTPDQIAVDTAALKYLSALREWEAAPDEAKNRVGLETAIENLNQARTKGTYLDAQLQQELDRGQAALAQAGVAIRKGQEDIITAPIERAGIVARTGQTLATTTGTQIDNMLKMLGTLGTYPEQHNAVRELHASGAIDDDTTNAVMERLQESLRTGVSPEKRFEETKQTERQVLAGQQAMEREHLQETGRQRTALQTAQTTAATSITGQEAERQRQLLTATASQQANQAQAVNSFINNYQTAPTANLNPVHTGEGFMGGLSMIRDIFSSLKDLTQPSPALGPSQNFIGNLLAGSPAAAGAPAVAGPAAPVGTGTQNMAAAAPPGGGQQNYLDDSLLTAVAMEDDTPLPPEDVAQIMPLMRTDPQRAANLSVAAWQRMVSGKSRVGAR